MTRTFRGGPLFLALAVGGCASGPGSPPPETAGGPADIAKARLKGHARRLIRADMEARNPKAASRSGSKILTIEGKTVRVPLRDPEDKFLDGSAHFLLDKLVTKGPQIFEISGADAKNFLSGIFEDGKNRKRIRENLQRIGLIRKMVGGDAKPLAPILHGFSERPETLDGVTGWDLEFLRRLADFHLDEGSRGVMPRMGNGQGCQDY